MPRAVPRCSQWQACRSTSKREPADNAESELHRELEYCKKRSVANVAAGRRISVLFAVDDEPRDDLNRTSDGRADWVGDSFAFETTLANRSYAHSIREWQAAGYHVALWFLALSSVEVALARVAQRVLQGGHDIPEEVVRRRFRAGKANFDEFYRGLVDARVLYDNSDAVPALLDWGEKR